MAEAAKSAIDDEKSEPSSSPPKPAGFPALSATRSDVAAQYCEHEWLAHLSHSSEVGEVGGEEGFVNEENSSSQFQGGGEAEEQRHASLAAPKPPIVAPTASSGSAAGAAAVGAAISHKKDSNPHPRDQADDDDASINEASSSISTPLSTPAASDEDDDLVPARGTFRSRRDATSLLPMTSPAISDGGGLRDEHVEDPWTTTTAASSSSGDGGGASGNEGDRSTTGGGQSLPSRLPLVGGIFQRRRQRVVRRELLPPSSEGNNEDDHARHHHRSKKKHPPKKRHRHLERTRSLRSPGRHFTVVTTASLPWMTGTSVNPTLRSAYLARALPRSRVTLLLPWLPPSQQSRVYPSGVSFVNPKQQEQHVRAWIRDRTGFDPPGLEIKWYHARYCPVMKSIFPYGDLTRLIGSGGCGNGNDDDDGNDNADETSNQRLKLRDVAILEEPEHLTWFHSGPRWTAAFDRAIGVAHTNYADYVSALRGRAAGAAVSAANRALVAVHTDAVIRLSDALPALPRARTAFVHGVARGFITAGRNAVPGRGCYYVGKALWAKGYQELVALMAPGHGWEEAVEFARSSRAEREWGPADQGIEDLPTVVEAGEGKATPFPPPSVDAFGSGEDADAIRAAAVSTSIPLTLEPGKDHLDPSLRSYRVFVNPSTSDVVATTSAEALALGRWLVCPIHPCNEFFGRFRACLRYGDERGFRTQLCRALSRPPPRLTASERASLTWAAATRRFLDAVEAPAERQRAQNARRKGIFLSASMASLVGGSSVGEEESDDEERRFQPPPTTLTTQDAEVTAPLQAENSGKLARFSNSFRAAVAAVAETLTHRAYGLAMRVEASRRLMGAGKFTRVAPLAPPGEGDHALEASRPCHVRSHEALGYRRSRYVGGMG